MPGPRLYVRISLPGSAPCSSRDLSLKLRGGRVNSIEFLATNRRGCCDSPEVQEKSDDMGSLVALPGIEPGFQD